MAQNQLYIGDNADVMNDRHFVDKYNNSIGLIYIDPPYNTLSRKSYSDKDDSSDWYSFMKKRLLLSLPLMRDDAIILISIDDNELANLQLCCNDVFGKTNFIGTFITKQSQRSNSNLINTVHEYVLCYAKNKKCVKPFSIKRMDIPEQKEMINELQDNIRTIFRKDGRIAAEKELPRLIKQICKTRNITWLKNYSNIDSSGRIFFAMDLSTPGHPRKVDIPEINLHLSPLPTRGWSTDARFIELHKKGRLYFKNGRPYSIKYLDESEDNVPSILNFYSRQGTHDLKRLGLQGLFDTPKPVEMLKFFIRMTHLDHSIILDYFGGSGSTGQAVYETNKEDGKNNHFVLIQKAEQVNKKSTAYTKCLELGVEPTIDKILERRLNTFLTKFGQPKDYTIIENKSSLAETVLSSDTPTYQNASSLPVLETHF
ncbi:site-specific DNA-methyltransferase [Candidatus Saccharibacteria bacterium]|nr:site-specific DNA-methyltransferase [Candidatus Saccharibacteria bacterium]